MKGETMLATMQRLGVAHTRSRPAVSNDNPYVESAFRTLKYRPQLPVKSFENLLAARRWVTDLAHWYNHEHRHSAIGFVTPAQRNAGLDHALLQARTKVYERARQANPQRWSRQLLYTTHCIKCHTTQMHWRQDRGAHDWDSLKGQVRRWQGNAGLGWNEVDIAEVARHLNDTTYRHPQTSDRLSLAR